MSNVELFKQELERLNRLYGIEVFAKDRKWSGLWKTVTVLYAIITFGKVQDWNERFTITVGKYIFFPPGWRMSNVDALDYVTLLHEGDGHVRQCYQLGHRNVWRGLPLFLFLYALCWFPIGLAWFRYKFEREAYVISYKASKTVGYTEDLDSYVERMTGPAYFWAWPFKKYVRRYFYAHCK